MYRRAAGGYALPLFTGNGGILLRKIEPLANDYIKLYETDIDRQEYAYTPGICVLPNGRIIATMDHVYKGLAEIEMNSQRGLIFLSDDGENFRFIQHFPAGHARPFVAGNSVYVLGQHGRLVILRSDDWGETWSEPCFLTDPEENGRWHGSATSVWYEEDRVYMVMEHTVAEPGTPWPVAAIAPVLLRAKVTDDLTKRESWTFASELRFRDHVNQAEMDDFGVPFFEAPYNGRIELAPRRGTSPIGWLEFNVARIKDEKHYWYDPSGRTYHLLGRGHTAGTGYAAMVKVVEKEDGTMETMFEHVPSGRRVVYRPLPGGQLRFHILYDDETKLYWLLSTQATDSKENTTAPPPLKSRNTRKKSAPAIKAIHHRVSFRLSVFCIAIPPLFHYIISPRCTQQKTALARRFYVFIPRLRPASSSQKIPP